MQTREDKLQSFGGNIQEARVGMLLSQLGLASTQREWQRLDSSKQRHVSPSSRGKPVPSQIKSVYPI